MTKPYRELVGLQVTFSDIASIYNIEHFYKWRHDGKESGTLTIKTYDMQLTMPQEDIVLGLERAFAPVVLSVWNQTKAGSSSEYLQFRVGARPDEVGLGTDWTLTAEW